MTAAISTSGLSKDYAGGRGLFDLDLEVADSEVLGYLGPHGAGKTTTIAAARSHRERVGGASPERLRLRVEELVQGARLGLDDSEAAMLEAQGRAMSLSEAIDVATKGWDRTEEAGGQTRHRAGPQLTRREEQVARLVAEGLTNRHIADRLFISPRTAEYHVEQIRNKLGFQSRAQVAAWSVRERGVSGDQARLSRPEQENR
jgi:DNA-binding CsgD family transcriptional regulator